MDHPDNETTEVLVVVSFPEAETRASEDAWEQVILDAVSNAVYADKTLDTIPHASKHFIHACRKDTKATPQRTYDNVQSA